MYFLILTLNEKNFWSSILPVETEKSAWEEKGKERTNKEKIEHVASWLLHAGRFIFPGVSFWPDYPDCHV